MVRITNCYGRCVRLGWNGECVINVISETRPISSARVDCARHFPLLASILSFLFPSFLFLCGSLGFCGSTGRLVVGGVVRR